jgi:hypothetical protein
MTVSPIGRIDARAAVSTRISFSDPQAKAGEEFTVTMKITALSGGNLGSTKVSLKYDTAYLQFLSGDHTSDGSAGIVLVTGDSSMGTTEYSFSLKFKALAQGTTSLEINDYELYDVDSKAASLDKKGSSAITIAQGETGASDATLKSLKISPGTLTPAFDPEVTEYTAVVAETIEKVTVSAPTSDANAKVVISGNSGLVLGENTVTCKVTAQDGSSNTYTITVTRQEGLSEEDATEAVSSSSDKAVVNGIEYDVAATFDDSIIPDGYNSQEVEYHGGRVKAAVEADRGITLIYLIASDGTGDFFVYDAGADSWSPWAQLNVSQKSFTIVPLGEGTEVPEGFVDSTIELNGKKIHGWVWGADTEQKYCIVYAMNSEGDRNFYRYDMKEKTVQRYFSDPAAQQTSDDPEYTELVEKYNALIKDYNLRGYFMTGLAVVAVILLIAVILLFVADGKKAAPGSAKKSGRSGSTRDDRRNMSSGSASSRTSGTSKSSRNADRTSGRSRTSLLEDDEDENADYGMSERRSGASLISPKKNAQRRRIERIEEQVEEEDLSPTEALPPVAAVRRHKEQMDAEEHYLRGNETVDPYAEDADRKETTYTAGAEEDEDEQASALMAHLAGRAERQAKEDLAQHVGESAQEIDEEDDFSNVSL